MRRSISKKASAATDRRFANRSLWVGGQVYVRFAPEGPEASSTCARRSRSSRRTARRRFISCACCVALSAGTDLGELLDERAEKAATFDETRSRADRVVVSPPALGSDNVARADRAVKQALAHRSDASARAALVVPAVGAAGDWARVGGRIRRRSKAKRDGRRPGRHVACRSRWCCGDSVRAISIRPKNIFAAFARSIRAHPAALDFYRAYYTARRRERQADDAAQACRRRGRHDRSPERNRARSPISYRDRRASPRRRTISRRRSRRGNNTCAKIPGSVQARGALARLYKRTENGDALLDLMKDEVERLPETDIAGRVARLFEVVEIYRDRLRLDVMVINTTTRSSRSIRNQRATDELAAKFRALGRWNDLIAILTRRSERRTCRMPSACGCCAKWRTCGPSASATANTIKPLRRIVEIMPGDREVVGAPQRSIRSAANGALIDILGKETAILAGVAKRTKQGEMARLAAERLGDTRLAIEIYNTVLAEADGGDGASWSTCCDLPDRLCRRDASGVLLARIASSSRAPSRRAG